MVSWFKKAQPRDRLQEEIERLEREQRRLEKQTALLEDMIRNPVVEQEEEISRMATIKLDDLPTNADGARPKKRLRTHQRRLRNRFFLMLGLLTVLGLIFWRLLA